MRRSVQGKHTSSDLFSNYEKDLFESEMKLNDFRKISMPLQHYGLMQGEAIVETKEDQGSASEPQLSPKKSKNCRSSETSEIKESSITESEESSPFVTRQSINQNSNLVASGVAKLRRSTLMDRRSIMNAPEMTSPSSQSRCSVSNEVGDNNQD